MVNEPLRLNKCPIIESIFEMRFESQHDANVVFALIYGALKDDFMKVESLPVAELPPTIRDNDPNLKFQPAYKLRHKDNNSFLQIGAKMVGFSFMPTYTGWNDFKSFVSGYLQTIKSAGVVGRVLRIGFRVINFIDVDIFKENRIKLNISLEGNDIPYEETSLKTVFSEGNYHSNLSIINHAQLNSTNPVRSGSVIDIDTYSVLCENFFENITNFLDELHSAEKHVFFRLLTDKFLDTLQPEYE